MTALPPILQTSLTYPLVIGCSVFGIAWGVVNIFLVSQLSMLALTAGLPLGHL